MNLSVHPHRRLPARPLAVAGLVCAVVALGPRPGAAQLLPSSPLSLADGRVVVGGEASAAIAPVDRGYFNHTDYDHNTLRLVRLGALAEWHLASRASVVGEVRTENWDRLRPYALYVRVRPWAGRTVDVQVGRIPPNFGAFARRSYGPDNLLIGYPLAYQYLTTLRSDAVPASADDLLAQRGRGWRVAYPIGAREPARGLPLFSAFRWDTGVQIRMGQHRIEGSVAVTNGTLSNPRVDDDNGGKQVSGHVTLRPTPAWVLGFSAAHGAYLGRTATDALPDDLRGRTYAQRAVGVDADYSRDHWLVRGEVMVSSWQVPDVSTPTIRGPLHAAAYSVEGRYKLRPGLYGAARLEHLQFSRISGATYRSAQSWDAPVTRLEVGGGYSLARNAVLRASYQHNWRDSGRYGSEGFAAAQLHYWF